MGGERLTAGHLGGECALGRGFFISKNNTCPPVKDCGGLSFRGGGKMGSPWGGEGLPIAGGCRGPEKGEVEVGLKGERTWRGRGSQKTHSNTFCGSLRSEKVGSEMGAEKKLGRWEG